VRPRPPGPGRNEPLAPYRAALPPAAASCGHGSAVPAQIQPCWAARPLPPHGFLDMGARGTRLRDIWVSTRAADDGLPHVDLGPQLNLVFWLLTSLAFVFLALRIYCKFHRGRKLWWDDYLLIAAWVRTATLCTKLGVSVSSTWRHRADARRLPVIDLPRRVGRHDLGLRQP
jgi:hypothetical protein